jgi:RimJ/RimL family protein N-acetyltransferase
MSEIPEETIRAFARTIVREAQVYGFSFGDTVRLIGTIMDVAANADVVAQVEEPRPRSERAHLQVDRFPLESTRLQIRRTNPATDQALLERWIDGSYGRYFLQSCATAQQLDLHSLLTNPVNEIGIVTIGDNRPIGAVAFLDVDHVQRRAELRKLIGEPTERGKGYAEEATALWVEYGRQKLALEKIYLSTLQTHLRNIKLNESIGFRVEGILRSEVRLDGVRYDVLRMGLSLEPQESRD